MGASGITGLASRVSIKTEEGQIEWGDIDPELATRLRRDPEALKTYRMVCQPIKQARLDPTLSAQRPGDLSVGGVSK